MAQSSRREKPVSTARQCVDYHQGLGWAFALDNLLYKTLRSKSTSKITLGTKSRFKTQTTDCNRQTHKGSDL
jgi:hypothetical protein